MSENVMLAWVLIVTVIGLNLASAGAVAALHIWRGGISLRRRIVLAAAISGLIPASALAAGMDLALPYVMLLASAFVFVCGMVASLPLGIAVARKLERGGEEYRVFE